jgi:hypothetical protein
MQSLKKILDIRYYESINPNIDGQSLPSNIGKIFNFDQRIINIGSRFARKLREYGYLTGSFDHLYINFTTCLPERNYQISTRNVEKWIKYVDFGLTTESIHTMPYEYQLTLITETTFNILKQFNSICKENEKILNIAYENMINDKESIKILHKEKDNKLYNIKIKYQIEPETSKSIAWIEYTDKSKGTISTWPFLDLVFYDDIFSIINTISVIKGNIILKPRKSYKSTLIGKEYKLPIILQANLTSHSS